MNNDKTNNDKVHGALMLRETWEEKSVEVEGCIGVEVHLYDGCSQLSV